jgi:hypothetical protein
MKVYVIFDPLLERVVCVHEEADMECKDCKELGVERGKTAYYLSEHEREVVLSKETNRNDKLKDIGI